MRKDSRVGSSYVNEANAILESNTGGIRERVLFKHANILLKTFLWRTIEDKKTRRSDNQSTNNR